MKGINTLTALVGTPTYNRDPNENGYNDYSVRTLHVNVPFGL